MTIIIFFLILIFDNNNNINKIILYRYIKNPNINLINYVIIIYNSNKIILYY